MNQVTRDSAGNGQAAHSSGSAVQQMFLTNKFVCSSVTRCVIQAILLAVVLC